MRRVELQDVPACVFLQNNNNNSLFQYKALPVRDGLHSHSFHLCLTEHLVQISLFQAARFHHVVFRRQVQLSGDPTFRPEPLFFWHPLPFFFKIAPVSFKLL